MLFFVVIVTEESLKKKKKDKVSQIMSVLTENPSVVLFDSPLKPNAFRQGVM